MEHVNVIKINTALCQWCNKVSKSTGAARNIHKYQITPCAAGNGHLTKLFSVDRRVVVAIDTTDHRGSLELAIKTIGPLMIRTADYPTNDQPSHGVAINQTFARSSLL